MAGGVGADERIADDHAVALDDGRIITSGTEVPVEHERLVAVEAGQWERDRVAEGQRFAEHAADGLVVGARCDGPHDHAATPPPDAGGPRPCASSRPATARDQGNSSARRRAASRLPACRHVRTAAARSSSTPPQPAGPPTTSSARAPPGGTAMGVPHARASRAARPNVSWGHGHTTTSADASTPATAERSPRCPANRTGSPPRRARRPRRRRSGPSPTTVSAASIACRPEVGDGIHGAVRSLLRRQTPDGDELDVVARRGRTRSPVRSPPFGRGGRNRSRSTPSGSDDRLDTDAPPLLRGERRGAHDPVERGGDPAVEGVTGPAQRHDAGHPRPEDGVEPLVRQQERGRAEVADRRERELVGDLDAVGAQRADHYLQEMRNAIFVDA